jgi:hypothetical protein
MNNLLLMAVDHRRKDLPHEVDGFAFTEIGHLLDPVKQLASAGPSS